MNIEQTPEQKIQMLEAQVEKLKAEKAALEENVVELCGYSDDEIRHEFLSRGFIDPATADYERLADHIARGETDDALSLLADISEGAVSPAVAKMLVKAHAQESFL